MFGLPSQDSNLERGVGGSLPRLCSTYFPRFDHLYGVGQEIGHVAGGHDSDIAAVSMGAMRLAKRASRSFSSKQWDTPLSARALCYNDFMTLKDDLKAYQARWAEVEAVVEEERRTASIALRWQQLNAAYAMAKSLGMIKTDPSEAGVFERWAKLKEKAVKHSPKA